MNKNRLYVILSVVFLVLGIGVLFYPATGNIIFMSQQNKVIDDYNQQIELLEDNELKSIKEDAVEYNEKLSDAANSQASVDVVSGNLSYSQLLNLSNEQMGYIVIPKISLNQPIYHGTSDEVLERGIGHMENTSLPVGGESTHCVLSGHSAVPGMMLFTDLKDVELHDKFYIKTLDEILAYEVDSIKVVLPNDASDLQIFEGEDYVTLLTCTPYSINTHRLLVRGTRVSYNGEIDEKESEKKEESTSDEVIVAEKQNKFSLKFILYYVVIPSIISVVLVVLFVVVYRKIKKKRVKNSDET